MAIASVKPGPAVTTSSRITARMPISVSLQQRFPKLLGAAAITRTRKHDSYVTVEFVGLATTKSTAFVPEQCCERDPGGLCCASLGALAGLADVVPQEGS